MYASKMKSEVSTILGKGFRLSLFAALAIGLAPAPSEAGITYSTLPGAKNDANEALSAEAEFTLGNGTIVITLTNLLGNPKSDAQEISAIVFKVSGLSGNGALATVNSGEITTIVSGGSYTPGAADPLTRWKASHASDLVTLTTLSGGQPNRLIIGPDDQGNFDPSLGGKYSNANASIIVHQPSVLGTATFTITAAGVTPNSVLSDVVFQFGTAAGRNLADGFPPNAIPEPSSIVMISTAACAAGLALRRRRRPTVA